MFSTPEWAETWWRHFGGRREILRLYLLRGRVSYRCTFGSRVHSGFFASLVMGKLTQLGPSWRA